VREGSSPWLLSLAASSSKIPIFLAESPYSVVCVPFKALIDDLEGGDTFDQFLEEYPSVSRELAVAAIEEARLSLVEQLK